MLQRSSEPALPIATSIEGTDQVRERLTSAPSEVIKKHLINSRLFGNLEPDFLQMSKINKAHVVMLIETRVLSPSDGSVLLSGLTWLDRQGVAAIEFDPEREDLYFNLEHVLIGKLGEDIGGRLHTARSRNDLYASMQRMKIRNYSIAMSSLLLKVITEIVTLAGREIDTVMTGYTHMQPAQPITAGHYLTAVSQGLLRDAQRLIDSYDRINLSPLGACALATTTYPIDRERTAALLGFDGLVENSIDAVASRDYVPELLFDFAMTATTISRFCADLHVWYTAEFGYVGIDDSIAGTSSIMPQKKNPSPIEHLKAKASHLYGALVGSLAAQRGAAYTHGREVGTESTSGLAEALKQTEAIFELTNSVVQGLQFRKSTLLDKASSNFSTLTELADAYVTSHGLSFRAAHQITGTLVRECHARGIRGTTEITSALVNSIATDVLGYKVDISEADLRKVLNPSHSIERRRVKGGPARDSVASMLADQTNQISRLQAIIADRQTRLSGADLALEAAVRRHSTKEAA